MLFSQFPVMASPAERPRASCVRLSVAKCSEYRCLVSTWSESLHRDLSMSRTFLKPVTRQISCSSSSGGKAWKCADWPFVAAVHDVSEGFGND